jgi:tRNA-(ms[2]io[6]A)-hydroxylase
MMLHLLTPSPQRWLPVALSDLPALLLDHAHCEMKAVASAKSFAERYPENTQFVADMYALAEEEESHYDRVRAILEERGIAWVPAKKDRYVVHLLKQVRTPAKLRLIDRLLIASVIEGRSCERLGLLADAFEEPALKCFYRELFESEARHHGLFLEWARHFGGRKPVDERLAALVAYEAEYVSTKEPTPTVHG